MSTHESKKTIVLITGGGRSGKSRHALELSSSYKRKVFVATAEGCDSEMRQRIIRHREERDSSFVTIEEPLNIAGSLHSLPDEIDVVVIDCLTVWLGNLMHRKGLESLDNPEVISFLEMLKRPSFDVLIVTNEVGLGIIPENPIGRQFRDLSGKLNQEVASLAKKVILMISGIPMIVK